MNSKNNSKLNDAVKRKISGLADSNFTPDLEIIFPKGLRTLSDSDPAMVRLLGMDLQAFWDRISQDPEMVGAGFKPTPKAIKTLAKFSGLSGIKATGNNNKLMQQLTTQLTGKTPNPDKVAKAWIELLSNDSRNLFTVLMLSLQLNEKMPVKIWEMANELMIIDEIKLTHADINADAQDQVDKILADYHEAIQRIEEAHENVDVTSNDYGQDEKLEIRDKDEAEIEEILDRALGDHNGEEGRPDMVIHSFEMLQTVCKYLCNHEGCLIPRISVDAPDHLADINEIKRTLDIIEQNPQEGLSLLRGQIGMVGGIEYNSNAPRLELKPPTATD